jgi:two-component system, LuxR family, response regulator FixJ
MSHQRPVYVIDHDLGSRRSLASFLGGIGAEAWPFESGAEFLAILDHLMPACILLDVDGPEPCGLEVMAELMGRGCGWPVVAMSGRQDVSVAVEAMKLGALDFLEKPVRGDALAAALAPAWAALRRSIEASEVRRMAQERVARLTPREVDISMALFSGQPNKAVAHEFGISVRTVEMHRAHIMAKLGVKNLAEAAVLAAQAGLVLTSSSGAAPAPPPGPAYIPAARPRVVPMPRAPLARRLPFRSAH